MIRKQRYFLLFLIFACILTACGNKHAALETTSNPQENTHQIMFPESFEKLSGMDEFALSDYLKENGDYTNLSIEDGQVVLLLNEEQIDYWKNYSATLIADRESILKAVNSRYYASYDEPYNVIKIFCDTKLSFRNAFDYLGKTAIYCAINQIFHGNEDYSLSLEIYNIDTGKLVTGGDLKLDDVSYGDLEWERSYRLNSKQATNLKSSFGTDSLEYRINSDNPFSIIRALQSSGKNNYQCLYIDEDNDVILIADKSQQEALLDDLKKVENIEGR